MTGALILIVGPSGAGKDTLIAGARAALSGDRSFVFPTRFITRGGDAGGEAHMPLEREEFQQMSQGGFFSLEWEAHGLRYGIPSSIRDDLARGRSVVVNVSRTILAEARERFAAVRVIEVTASAEILSERLASRGREDGAAIEGRLARADYAIPQGLALTTIENDGAPDEGIRRFLTALQHSSR